MPKFAQSLLTWSPQQNGYVLHEQGQQRVLLLQGDDEDWLAWLAAHTSFSFQGPYGRLNVQKETRQRGGSYWYAFQRQGEHVAKRYVGQTTDVSPARLETIAELLAGKASPASQAGSQGKEPAPGLSDRERQENLLPVATDPQDVLLVFKFHFPHLPATLVARERLLARLDAASACKLTLLSAPAGFGKTTLLSQWIHDRRAQGSLPPVAWISLDPGDNDPVRFWRYVITACQVFQPDLAESSLALLSAIPHVSFERSFLEGVLTTFLNRLTQLPSQGILVLEDYHVITSSLLQEMVSFLLEHLPTTLHLIIVTRHTPSLPLVQLRARGDLCEVTGADLRFTPQETATFLQQIVSFPLPSEALHQLDIHLEGWAVGLRLLALLQRCGSQQEWEQMLSTFSGSHRSLIEYFVTEVLGTQPEPMQRFLLSTSILSCLTGPLCDAVTGRSDSEQLLKVLERTDLLLIPLGGDGQWYRYHTLFAEAIRAEASHRLGVDEPHALSSRASRWFEHHGNVTEAIEAALLAQDFVRAVALIEQRMETRSLLEITEFHTLRRWLDQIPDLMFRQHPLLALSSATALLFGAASDQPAPPLLDQLQMVLRTAEDGFRKTGNLSRLGEVFSLRALLARKREALCEAVTWARQALAWLPEGDVAGRSISLSVLEIEARQAGQLETARTILLEERALCETTGNHPFTRALTGMLGEVCLEQGMLHQAAVYYHQMLTEAKQEEDLNDIAHARLGLAQLFYEWNRLEEAWDAAQEAHEIGKRLAHEELQVLAMLVLARVECARGQTASAQQRTASLLAWMQPQRQPFLYRAALAWQTRLQLAVGNCSAVQHWVNSRNQPKETRMLRQQEEEELLLARWLLAQGEEAKALERLVSLLTPAQEAGRTRSVLEIQLLMALVHIARKQRREARDRLQAVLVLAQSENYLRLFLDEGEVIITHLRALVPTLHKQPLRVYLQAILQAEARSQAGQYSSPAPDALTHIEQLSTQELRVLRLLATGRSNPEIARELIVSVNTIRTQVQSIYRKLGVNNRVAASEVARHFQLA